MKTGDTIDARFVLESEAGRGAMGIVYRARDATTGAMVAVKILGGADDVGARRFQRESEVLSRLRHPRIVGYVAHGRTVEGQAYLAMEWLAGETLKARVDRQQLTYLETIDVGCAVAEALVAAHEIGVIHRDLKPSNLILVGDGVKVVDFGIARTFSTGHAGGSPLTATGETIGTPAFMSPEQALGKRELDHRTDLFSLGSVLYQCLSGTNPFEAENALEMLVRLTTERAAPIATVAPGIPAALAAAIDAMMSPEPEGRPASAAAVHAFLRTARRTLSPEAAMTRPMPRAARTTVATKVAVSPPRPRKTPRDTRWIYIAIFAIGASSLVVLAAVWAFTIGPLGGGGARPSRPKARTTKTAEGRASAASVRNDPPVADNECPTNAVACGQTLVADASHADPFVLATAALEFTRRFVPRAEIGEVRVYMMTENGVDLASGGSVLVIMAPALKVEITEHKMVLSSFMGVVFGAPWTRQSCDSRGAMRAAIDAGFPRDRAASLVYSVQHGYQVQANDNAFEVRLIDPATCKRVGAAPPPDR